jgi:SAM-dependent methyltransferase
MKSGDDLFPLAITDDIQVQAYLAGRDSTGRSLIGIPEKNDVDAIYRQLQIRFWRDVRSRENASTQLRALILKQQQDDYSKGTKRSLASFIAKSLERSAIAGAKTTSVLELGCANGATIRHFNRHHPETELRFFGIELTDFLVDNLLARHPEAMAVVGGGDEFLDMGAEDFGTDSFDLFVAAGVLCQIPPDVAANILKHAAAFCDEVLLWEYLENFDGSVSDTDSVIFKLEQDSQHILFLNPYRNMLEQAGFTDITVQLSEEPNTPPGPSEGAVWARKPKST